MFLWTDSSVSLAWINSHPSRWKEFVRNRVILIQELLPQGQWRLIPGKENPADCASRGLSSSQLVKHKLWWTGPPWLVDSSSSWPILQSEPDSSCQIEEKPGILLVSQVAETAVWDLISKFSSLRKLLRITAICQRVVSRLRKTPGSSVSNPLMRRP